MTALGVLALVVSSVMPAAPLWPCTVPVSIEAGPWRSAAVAAVEQLDAATVIAWPIVDAGGPAVVTIGWAELEEPAAGETTLAASRVGLVSGRVDVDPDVPGRWVMTSLLHELGHVAGLGHNQEARSVMNATATPWRRFQRSDLEQLGGVVCR